MRHHECGCPTLRGFRSVGTTDFDTLFIHHIQRAAFRGICPNAQSTPSLLRRRIFALYHHQLLPTPRVAWQPEKSRPLSPSVGAGTAPLSFCGRGLRVMPEHVHLLFGEPERGNPSIVMQAIKRGFARRLLRNLRSQPDPRQGHLWSASLEAGHIWQRRFYDFVVFSERKRVEKLRYMHRNPVKRGLVLEPQRWAWSSFRHYADGERGAVLVNEAQKAELRVSKVA